MPHLKIRSIKPDRHDYIVHAPKHCVKKAKHKKGLGVFYCEKENRSFVYDADAYRKDLKQFEKK